MYLLVQERENTLKKLEIHLSFLSGLYKKCYLKKGRGAIVLYPFHVDNITELSCIDYNSKDQSIDLFDDRNSRKDLDKLIDNYDPRHLVLLLSI